MLYPCTLYCRKFDKFTAELHPVPLCDEVWHTIGVDLIGPLPETARRYYDLCRATSVNGPAEATALPDKSAKVKTRVNKRS